MGLYQNWQSIAYSETTDKGELQRFWSEYFLVEKGIYEEILKDTNIVVKGTVKELAEKFQVDLLRMTGFLDGINESLKKPNDLENLEEDSKVQLGYDIELLYKNMVAAEAEWLYGLEAWQTILDDNTRKHLYKEQKSSTTVVKEEKVYPNDPCPCDSGKKYKKCCGK
ncbi:MAG: SEC-C metal-binding domain-containing protein [Eubacteriales bacterium]